MSSIHLRLAPPPSSVVEMIPGAWGVQSLWDQLSPVWPQLSIEVVERLPSTNQALLDRLRDTSRSAEGRGFRADDLAPSLLVAVQQTQGRGRLGRSWESTPGASLTFSLSLPIGRADWSGLSLAVGLAVARSLDPAGDQIALKWPNDLWRLDAPGQGRKLGGILIESMPVGPHRVAVIGIGINVRPVNLPDLPVASLQEFLPELSAAQVLARIMPELAQVLQQFEREGFGAMVAAYGQRDLLKGGQVSSNDPLCPQGQGLGVADDGALLLRDGAGRIHRIVSGEVSVRPQQPASD